MHSEPPWVRLSPLRFSVCPPPTGPPSASHRPELSATQTALVCLKKGGKKGTLGQVRGKKAKEACGEGMEKAGDAANDNQPVCLA